MSRISLASAQPGQVLAQPVTNAIGAILCPAGHHLTEETIARLHTAGIKTIEIVGGQSDAPTPAERIEALEHRFDGIDDPILLQIKAAIKKRLTLIQLEQEA